MDENKTNLVEVTAIYHHKDGTQETVKRTVPFQNMYAFYNGISFYNASFTIETDAD